MKSFLLKILALSLVFTSALAQESENPFQSAEAPSTNTPSPQEKAANGVEESSSHSGTPLEREPASLKEEGVARDLAGEDETLIAKVIQDKNFPGARDEDDIEVQPQLNKPTRKMGSNKENVETAVFDDEF